MFYVVNNINNTYYLLYPTLHITTSIVAGAVVTDRRMYVRPGHMMAVLTRTVPILSSPEANCRNRLWAWGMLEDR